jgi:hypothetical protein
VARKPGRDAPVLYRVLQHVEVYLNHISQNISKVEPKNEAKVEFINHDDAPRGAAR